MYARAAAIAPSEPEVLLERARMLYALKGDYLRALKETARALAHAGSDKWLRFEILRLQGRIFFALDRDDKAIQAYRAALRLRPGDIWLLADIGKALVLSGHPAQALRYLERALRLSGSLDFLDRGSRDFVVVAKAEALAALERHWDVLRTVRAEMPCLRDPIARQVLGNLGDEARRLGATTARSPREGAKNRTRADR